MSVWRQRLAAARILGTQGLAIAPMAMIALLAFTAVRFGDNGFSHGGARVVLGATAAALVATFVNSYAFGQITQDGQAEMLLKPTPDADNPRSLTLWLRSRTALSLLLGPAIAGFIWAVV